MAIPDDTQDTKNFWEQQQYQALHFIIDKSGLSEDFVVWYLQNYYQGDALSFLQERGQTSDKQIKSFMQSKFSDPDIQSKYAKWQQGINLPKPSAGEEAERKQFLGPDPQTDPFGALAWRIEQQQKAEEEAAQAEAGQGAAQGSPGGALVSSVADVFSGLTPEELQGLGAQGISEKFGLQRLAIEEPEAFLQAMFDKAGISPSPPVYGFLRDLMPSLVLLASTREGQDIINSPGGAVQLNKAINEVISQGYPSRGSILEGLSAMGGLGRAFLGEGISGEPRTEFKYIAATLNDLLGPTMAQPLRQALFNTRAIETQGDRFLSAAARGVFQGSFIDWLKGQGYPIPELPAFKPTPGATEQAGAAPFVAAVTGGATGTSTSGAPTFQVKGGVYEEK